PGRLRTTLGRLSPSSGEFPLGNLQWNRPRATPHHARAVVSKLGRIPPGKSPMESPQGDSAPRSGGCLQARENSPWEISNGIAPGRLGTTFGRLSPSSGDFPLGNLQWNRPRATRYHVRAVVSKLGRFPPGKSPMESP